MDARQQLVEEWKVKLSATAPTANEREGRLDWLRQIYSRIYRFLISSYGQGDWRGARDELNLEADSKSTASRMPFVEQGCTTDGLLPKSPEQIRAALESIHSSNPGLVTAGPTVGIEYDTWVVVAARKKSRFANAVYRRLVASGIEACLQSRTTDTAVVVRYEDFNRALEAMQHVGRAKRIRSCKRVNQTWEVGIALILLSMIAAVLAFFTTL